MFSARTRWDVRPNRLARLVSRKRAEGARLIDLTESNPTRVGLPFPEDLLSLLADPGGRIYEPAPLGLAEARAAVAADFARRGAPLSPDRVVLTASTSEAYAFLFKLLCDPGDEVLVPEPGYPLFDYLAGLEAVLPRPYRLDHDGEWRLDPAALRDALGARCRAVLVVSPGNPTGAYVKDDERDALEALAALHGLAVVSDEVFSDFPLRDDPRRVRSLARDGPALTFTLGGLSKSCGLPQLKLAWIAVTGPAPLVEDALARLEVVADTYLSVSTPVQRSAAALLARQEELRAPIAARVRANLDALRAALGPASPATLVEPEGGWSALVRVPATVTDEERALRLLGEHDVLVHPGRFFGFPAGAFLVLSLIAPPSDFSEGAARLARDLVL